MCQLLTLEGTCLHWRVPLGPSKCAGILCEMFITTAIMPQHAKRQVQTCHFKRDGLALVLGDINILKNHIWAEFPRTDNSLSKCHKCLIFNFLVTYALTNCYNIVLNQ